MLRRWDKSDIRRIAELENECFQDPWSEKMITSSFDGENFFGFVSENNGIKGYVGVDSVFDTADILLIAVEESSRRKGVATELLCAAQNEAGKRGAKRLMLEVAENNSGALRCYEKFGFKKIGERKSYYGGGINAIIMEKKI